MQTYKYIGDDPVDVPALALVEVTKGTRVEVSPEQADGMKGSDLWEHVPDKRRSQAAKKAAETRAENEEG